MFSVCHKVDNWDHGTDYSRKIPLPRRVLECTLEDGIESHWGSLSAVAFVLWSSGLNYTLILKNEIQTVALWLNLSGLWNANWFCPPLKHLFNKDWMLPRLHTVSFPELNYAKWTQGSAHYISRVNACRFLSASQWGANGANAWYNPHGFE